MFAAPWGLLALLAIPAIVGLHLYRRRFQPREVSAVFLWLDADRTPLAGRKREKLRSSLSLWAECAAAAFFALALAGLRGCGSQPGEHLVAVLDASASMGAHARDGTLGARALSRLRERIDALPRGSRVTVVESGVHPRVLAGPAAFPAEALEKLARYAPQAQRHELTSAVAFALQVSGGSSVLVLTDHYEPDRFPPEVELASVGEPLDNVAFTHATRQRAREKDGAPHERVFLAVENLSDRARRATFTLDTVDAPVARLTEPRELELAAREKRALTFELPAGTGAIVARLGDDALAIDNTAWLAPIPPRTLGLATTLDEDDARVLGLRSGGASPQANTGANAPRSRIDRWLAIVGEATEAASADVAHVVIGRDIAGGAGAWSLSIEATSARAGERKDWIGPFLIEKRHPLLEGVTLDGVVWSADPALALEGIPLVAAGNVPLLVEDERAGRRLVRLDLDPARSTLARSPDWPILLSNFCELRRQALPGPERTNLAVGDSLTYRSGGAVDETLGSLVFAREDGQGEARAWQARPTVLIDEIDAPGMYRLKQKERELARIAVSFNDAAESDLSALKSGERAATTSNATLAAGAAWLETLLLALAALAIAIDWFWLARAPRVPHVSGATSAGKEEARGLPAS